VIALAPEPPPSTEDFLSVVSASRLNCFHSCRLKFYFRYVVELVKPTTAALFVGKAVHAALQQWSQARWKGKTHDAETLKPVFLEEWENAQIEEPVRWEDAEEEEQKGKAWGLVEMYLAETPIPSGEKPEAVEVRVEADLGYRGLPTLVGIIDLVRPGGVILDFKTSASTPQANQVLHRNEIQLTAYGLLYREATGQKEGGLELHHLVKTKQPKLVVSRFGPVSQTQESKLMRSMESYVDGVQREDYVPSPGLQCAACEFLNECQRWKGGN
jgi:putative RecB family exonuclease